MSESAAQLLATIARLDEVFHTPDGKAFVTFPVYKDGQTHEETWPVRSKRYKARLSAAFYQDMKKPPPTQAMTETVALVEARALHGPVRDVNVRVAEYEGRIYVDLADEQWRASEVDATGWRIVLKPPVKFRRAPGMLPLPDPVPGGSLTTLRKFINVGVDDDHMWRLVIHWTAMALHPRGPYPLLALHGEQGTAKTTLATVIRSITDPNASPIRSEPRDIRDLMIAANNGWIVTIDNASHLPTWLSDGLCRLATGGGFATRELYSDDEEVIFSAKRPVIITGIEEVVNRGDLMSRSLLVELPVIPSDNRREEGEFWAEFENARPALFGALLDAVAGGLRESPHIRLSSLPRMADFGRWSVAVELGLGWMKGQFMATYDRNIADAHEVVVESSPVAQAVRALADEVEWKGTVSELLETLTNRAAEVTRRSKSWPKSARALSGALRRFAPDLRALGVMVEFCDERALGARRRQVRVLTVPCVPDRSGVGPGRNGPTVPGNGQSPAPERSESRVGTLGNGWNGESPTVTDEDPEPAWVTEP